MPNIRTDRSAPLTDIAVAYGANEFVGRRIFKPLPVDERVGEIPVWDKAAWQDVDDLRAKGAPENDSETGWTYIPFVVEKHGLRDKIDDDDEKYNKAGIDVKGGKVRVLKKQVLLQLEKRILGAQGVLRNTANNVFSAHVSWTNLATMSSRQDIKGNAQAVRIGCGFQANTVLMAPNVADVVIDSGEYQKAREHTNDMNVAAGYPAKLWDLDLIVAGAVINSNKKGQANSNSYIMGNDVWVGYIDPSDSLSMEVMTYGALLWTEEYAREWYDQEIEATRVGYNYNYIPKSVAYECGSLLTNVLS